MKRHAKASAAGSISSGRDGLGSIRCAFALMVVAFVALVLAPVAHAGETPGGSPTATFGPSGDNTTSFTTTNSLWLTFDQARQRLFTLDVSAKKVYAFNSPGLSGSVAGFPLTVPAGLGYASDISVDGTESPSPTAGRLYFANMSAPPAVYAYDPAGSELTAPAFPNYPISLSDPSSIFQPTPCGVAVDSAGNLYLSDERLNNGTNEDGVSKYGPSGTPLGKLIAGGKNGLCDLAFDSNDDLYVAESGNFGHRAVWKYTAASGYNAASAVEIVPGADFSNSPQSIAVDSVRHLLYVVSSSKVAVYQTGDGARINDFATGIAGEQLRGVAVDENNGRVYVSNRANGKVYAFGFVPTPDVTDGFADTLTAGAATLHATVNPNGVPVSDCHFQYVDDARFQLHGFANAANANCAGNPGSGSTAVPVSSALSGLSSATEYHFRFFAANANGVATGAVGTFVTLGPQVKGAQASAISDTGATLQARINPNGEETTYSFQYVSQADFDQSRYANAVTVPVAPVGIGGGSAFVDVSQAISGLAPDTGYHYRAVASNPSATITGPDTGLATYRTPTGACPNSLFHTGIAADLPDCRAYEQVSPLFKNGYDIQPQTPAYSTPDGSAVAYTSLLGAFADSPASYVVNGYASRRDGSSWQTEPLTPPFEPVKAIILNNFAQVIGVSSDLSKQLVVTNSKLTPDAIKRNTNLYLHDSTDDSYRLLASTVSSSGTFFHGFISVNNDGSHAFFTTQNNPSSVGTLDSTPAPSPGQAEYTYESDEGQLKLVGVLPGGTVSPTSVEAANPFGFGGNDAIPQGHSFPAAHPVSADGSRIYWQIPNSNSGGNSPVYLQEGGHSALVSERLSDGSARSARFWNASDAGVGFLTSDGLLTANASAAGKDLYRYDPDVSGGELTDLTPSGEPGGSEVQAVLGISRDGNYVYFVAKGALAKGALSGASNMYVWHDGNIRFIGTLATGGSQIVTPAPGANTSWRVSPNGRYLGFLFGGRLAGPHAQPPHPFREAYLYDYRGDSLDCASCLPGGADPSGEPTLQARPGSFGEPFLATSQGSLTRNVNDSGQFFFNTPDALVPRDSNERLDVYEYESGQAHLISGGDADTDSYFADASASGNDVFFTTRESLVGQDLDPNVDLYDARVDGGLASQSAVARGASCQGDGCQGAFTTPPGGPGAGTAAFSGAGNPKPKRAKAHKHKKQKKHAKHHHERATNSNRRAGR